MQRAEQLVENARLLLEILERGEPFPQTALDDLVQQVERFCEQLPPDQEVPRPIGRLLTELVPALDAASQNYGERDAGRIRQTAATLFAIMLEKL